MSTATVSRALSTPAKVSEDKRLRIEAAIRETGFAINQAARSLRMREARTILVALPNIGNPYYSTILDAVVTEAASRGYGVLVVNRIGDDPTAWLRDYFYSNRADGMLLFDGAIDSQRLYGLPLREERLPLVVVCDEVLDRRFNLVTTDNFDASRRATQHLIDIGHTRIGIVRGPTFPGLRNERTAGFLAAMSGAGLVPALMFQGQHVMPSGVEAGRHIASLRRRPTAMFCANDEIAIGLISSLRSAGIACPDDISVVGFDDIEVAEHLYPPLTTMRQDRKGIGRTAARALIDIVEASKPPRQGIQVMLRSELILRGSTRALERPAPRRTRPSEVVAP